MQWFGARADSPSLKRADTHLCFLEIHLQPAGMSPGRRRSREATATSFPPPTVLLAFSIRKLTDVEESLLLRLLYIHQHSQTSEDVPVTNNIVLFSLSKCIQHLPTLSC